MPATFVDPARLIYQLQNTGLQNKDPQMYQLIYNLIGTLSSLNVSVTNIEQSNTNTVINNNIIGFPPLSLENDENEGPMGPPGLIGYTGPQGLIGPPGLDGENGEDAPIIPGPAGINGVSSVVPYFIAMSDTFTVDLYKQAVFAMNIEVQGMLEIDGFLIEVDRDGGSETTVNNQTLATFGDDNDNESIIFQLLQGNSLFNTVQITDTGTQNNYIIPFNGNTIVNCNNASLLTISGIANPTPGQMLIFSNTGLSQVNFINQSSGSSASNRLTNFINSSISALTPIASGGMAVYIYNGSTNRWQLIYHEQGSILSWVPTFTCSGAMTFTTSGSPTFQYYVRGRTVTLSFTVTGTVGGTPDTTINMSMPNSWSAAYSSGDLYDITSDTLVGLVQFNTSNLQLYFGPSTGANWGAGSHTLTGTLTSEIG